MSSNRFRAIKPKLEDPLARKDLTPKSSKYSPKISPVYSSVRGGLTMKNSQEPNNKIKLTRPSTSKNSNQGSANFFHSKGSNVPNQPIDSKKYYNSTKRIESQQSKTPKNNYEYQASRSKSKSPLKQPDEIIREEVYVTPNKSSKQENRNIKITKNTHPPLPKVLLPISNFEPAKHSLKPNGMIKGYSASTNQGPVRDYNEDRVAIILNIPKPEWCTEWKKVAYFGVFDGHGGMNCADFLRDHLHTFVAREKSFPTNMVEALTEGFEKCEKVYLQQSYKGNVDHSGSCAVVTFFHGNECYVANVGDSRAIMSSKSGQIIKELSLDHKASDEFEQNRIAEAGGRIYQTKLRNSNPNVKIFYEGEEHFFIMGPHRVFPGRLSVTRTFGDIEAKLPEFNGNPKGIISTPEIRRITVGPEDDFILLASDGIYDKLSNSEVVDIVWDTLNRERGRYKTLHEFCGKAVENIMKLAFNKKTLDNITVVMVALEGLQNYFDKLEANSKPSSLSQNKIQSQGNQIQPKPKISYKNESQMERKYIGRSTSPSNYASLKTRSFYSRN